MGNKKYKHNLIFTLLMNYNETNIDDFYEFFHDKEKLTKWLSFFPILWFTVDKDAYEEGATLTFKFSLLPFSYHMKRCEDLPNNKGYLVKIEGLVHGEGRVEFIEKEDGIFLYHALCFDANSKLCEVYYNIISKGHDSYMKWRIGILKKRIIKYSASHKKVLNGK